MRATTEDVLRIPSLDVSGSGLIAITGPSGAGKTTLVELLAGTLHEPYEGSVQVLGKEWRELRHDADRQRQLRRIGLVPQDFGLLPSWTPRRTLEQDLADAQVPSGERPARVQASLEQVDLKEFVDREIGALSGGQRQRVAIARMLARDVELVIADEPTANLDPQLVEEIGGLMKTLAEKVPVIVVTHDPRMAEICDRMIVLQATVTVPADLNVARTSALSPSRTRRRWLIVALSAVAALALAGGLIAVHNAQGHRAKPAVKSPAVTSSAIATVPTPSPSPVAPSPVTYPLVTVTLPVHVLPTTWAVTSPPPLLYPDRITVPVPSPCAGQVAAYGVDGAVFFGPTGWVENRATISVDGGESATLQAPYTSATPGQIDYEAQPNEPGVGEAAPYLPWVRDHWAKLGWGGQAPAAARLLEHRIGNRLVWYTRTRGSEVKHGLEVMGVARWAGMTSGFDRLEVALPPAEHALSMALLDYHLSPAMNAVTDIPWTLQNYFDAVNSHDLATAFQQLAPSFRATSSVSKLAAGMSTAQDTGVDLRSIKYVDPTTAVAYVTFDSTQDSSQGPNGDTSDSWTLDYRMVRVGGAWYIAYAGPHNGSTHTSG